MRHRPNRLPEASARTAFANAVVRTRNRYRNARSADRWYVATKLALDPIGADLFEEAKRNGSFGEVLDVACGRGQLGLLLLELDAARAVAGFDYDPEKVASANTADAHCWQADLRADWVTPGAEPVSADTILLIDVLHYLTEFEQHTALRRASQALRPGGRLIIRETSPEIRIGPRFWALAEQLAVSLGVNRGTRPRAVKLPKLLALLTSLGFEASQMASTNASHELVIARAPAVDLETNCPEAHSIY